MSPPAFTEQSRPGLHKLSWGRDASDYRARRHVLNRTRAFRENIHGHASSDEVPSLKLVSQPEHLSDSS